jgi:hypothetical protein
MRVTLLQTKGVTGRSLPRSLPLPAGHILWGQMVVDLVRETIRLRLRD